VTDSFSSSGTERLVLVSERSLDDRECRSAQCTCHRAGQGETRLGRPSRHTSEYHVFIGTSGECSGSYVLVNVVHEHRRYVQVTQALAMVEDKYVHVNMRGIEPRDGLRVRILQYLGGPLTLRSHLDIILLPGQKKVFRILSDPVFSLFSMVHVVFVPG